MDKRTINAPDAPPPVGGYSQAIEVRDGSRVLYISDTIIITGIFDHDWLLEIEAIALA